MYDSHENKIVLHTTSVGGVLTTSARPARQESSQSDRQMNRQTDSNQYVAVCATAIMSFYGAKCPARLRAVREKMLMAPPVPPVSLHHLSECSYWERGREERTNWDSNCNFSLHSQQEEGFFGLNVLLVQVNICSRRGHERSSLSKHELVCF